MASVFMTFPPALTDSHVLIELSTTDSAETNVQSVKRFTTVGSAKPIASRRRITLR